MLARQVTPVLNVSNLQQSFDWFERLGWTKSWEWGDPPDFGGVGSGDAEILLRLDGQGGRGRYGSWVIIWVDDVDTAYEQCLEQGLDVSLPPEDMPWNVREMHVRHPDGHVFRISMAFEE
ncbi:MAG TPA: bleomycin resistance family protein [Gemmatimonadaceae bacterium]